MSSSLRTGLQDWRSSLVVQWVKYLVLSLQQLRLLLWYRSNPWPRNFHVLLAMAKKKKKKKNRTRVATNNIAKAMFPVHIKHNKSMLKIS